VEVGGLDPGEIGPAAELLARAFRDNPLNRAVISHRSATRRLRANRWGMQTQLPTVSRHGLCLAARRDGPLVGGLLSVPPGRWPLPLPAWRDRIRCLFGQGLGVSGRWARVAELLHEHHEPLPHWYLALLGVEPAMQGSGVGAALLQAWLRLVDADGRGAYLETDTLRNVAFYERAGFRVKREIRLLETPVWFMERPPPRPGRS
jgi:ribosomal protein S18 acetylase RimI-like enzyme